jgi:3'(2'), 5'-bisphosphate nucleotidase
MGAAELDMYIKDDHELAAKIATDTGRILATLKSSEVLYGDVLGNAADAVAQQFIAHALRCHRPDDAVLSEEAPPDLRRLDSRRVWIVDPLDGTREYSEPGSRADWAVHIALCIDGIPAAAAVALPAEGMTYHTGTKYQNAPARSQKPSILVSRTRPTELAAKVANAVNAELVALGSAGAKAMAVLRGEADAYLAFGAMAEWDSCAPAAVCAAAGLHVSRADGTPLVFNKKHPRTDDLVICTTEIAPMLLAAIAAHKRNGP